MKLKLKKMHGLSDHEHKSTRSKLQQVAAEGHLNNQLIICYVTPLDSEKYYISACFTCENTSSGNECESRKFGSLMDEPCLFPSFPPLPALHKYHSCYTHASILISVLSQRKSSSLIPYLPNSHVREAHSNSTSADL